MTHIVDLVHQAYFHCIWHMGMNDRALIDTINLIFIAFNATAIHHCLSVWKSCECRVPPLCCPGGGAQWKNNSGNISYAVNNAGTDVFRSLNADFISSSPGVPSSLRDNICSIIRQRIHSTGMHPAMAQPPNYHASIDEDFLDCVPEELIEQPGNSFVRLSSFVAATDASMLFSAVLPMSGSAITRRSWPTTGSNNNNNSNMITNITSIENMGLVDGCMSVGSAMSLGGWKWCQWLNLWFLLCAILFQVVSIYHNSSKCNWTDGLLMSDLNWVKSWWQWWITFPWWLNNCKVQNDLVSTYYISWTTSAWLQWLVKFSYEGS